MHLGNGAVTPECAVAALGVAAIGAGVAVAVARRSGLDRGRAGTAAALGAAVFAAQLFNVQLLPFSSAHLIGGVLLAWMLGPAIGLLTMTGILTLQAVLLGDGGLLSLGANVVNMGLIPAAAVAFVRSQYAGGSVARTALTLGLTSFIATVAAAIAIIGEVSIGRSAAELEGLSAFTSQMLWSHMLAGVLEGAVTVALVGVLGGLASRESLPRLTTRRAAVVFAASLAVALLSLPGLGLASTAPDLYEAAVESLRTSGLALGGLETAIQSGISATAQSWQDAMAAVLAGLGPMLVLLTTVMAAALAWATCRLLTTSIQQGQAEKSS